MYPAEMQAVFEAAARLQELVPDAVLVGGTAAAAGGGAGAGRISRPAGADAGGNLPHQGVAVPDPECDARLPGFAALADRLGEAGAVSVVIAMDDYYADQIGPGGRRVATQVARQLAEPRPDDLSSVDLASYRKLDRRWQNWQTVADWCRRIAVGVLDQAAQAPKGTP